MKKLIVMAAALAVAIAGFGGLKATTTSADPHMIWVVNENVVNGSAVAADCALAFDCDLSDPADRAVLASSMDDLQAASALQVADDNTFSGWVAILIQTDGSATAVQLNGRGLTCTSEIDLAPCDGVATESVDTDDFALFWIDDVGTHSVGDSVVLTAVQDAVSLNSDAVEVVGPAHDLQLAVTKPTIQEAASSCEIDDSITAPTRGGAVATYTDINGTELVGYWTEWSSSDTGTLDVALSGAATPTVAMVLSGGAATGAGNVYCGDATGTADLTAANLQDDAIAGVAGQVERSEEITVTGVPASIALTASPATIACDGSATSTVTAKVTDGDGNDVVDNTNVNFSVVALGTANPINVKTASGEASSTITPLSGSTAGVTVIVTSGDAQASIRVDCALPVPTVPAASPTPGTGVIGGPDTGSGGFLGQDSSAGFPLWTLVALALGSMVLVGGGMVTRRSGK